MPIRRVRLSCRVSTTGEFEQANREQGSVPRDD